MHTLKRNISNRKSRQVGRGGKRGKTAGRGTKGQNARAGRKKRPEIRDTIKRYPKLRGYRFSSIQTKPKPVNLSTLESLFESGETVSPTTLIEKGLLKIASGKEPKVKILGTGNITKKLTISKCSVSESAKEKIVKVGGSVE